MSLASALRAASELQQVLEDWEACCRNRDRRHLEGLAMAAVAATNLIYVQMHAGGLSQHTKDGRSTLPVCAMPGSVKAAAAKKALVFADFASRVMDKAARVFSSPPAHILPEILGAAPNLMMAGALMTLITFAALALKMVQRALADGELRASDRASTSSGGDDDTTTTTTTVRELTDRLWRQLSKPSVAVAIAAHVTEVRNCLASLSVSTASTLPAGARDALMSSQLDLHCKASAYLDVMTWIGVDAFDCAPQLLQAAASNPLAGRPMMNSAAAYTAGPCTDGDCCLFQPNLQAARLADAWERSGLIEAACRALLEVRPHHLVVSGTCPVTVKKTALVGMCNLSQSMSKVLDLACKSRAPPASWSSVSGAATAAAAAAASAVSEPRPPPAGSSPLVAPRLVSLLMGPGVQKLQRCLLDRFVLDRRQEEEEQPPYGQRMEDGLSHQTTATQSVPQPDQQPRPRTATREEMPQGRAGSGSGKGVGGCGWSLLDVSRLHEEVGSDACIIISDGSRSLSDRRQKEAIARGVEELTLMVGPFVETWRVGSQLCMTIDGGDGMEGARVGGDGAAAASRGAAAPAPAAALDALRGLMATLLQLARSPWKSTQGATRLALYPTDAVDGLGGKVLEAVCALLDVLPVSQARARVPECLEAAVWALAVAAEDGRRAMATAASWDSWQRAVHNKLTCARTIAERDKRGTASLSTEQCRDLAGRLARAAWYDTINRLLRLLLASRGSEYGLEIVHISLMSLVVSTPSPASAWQLEAGANAPTTGGSPSPPSAVVGSPLSCATAATSDVATNDPTAVNAPTAASTEEPSGSSPVTLMARDLGDLLTSLAKLLSLLACRLEDQQKAAAAMLPTAGLPGSSTPAAAAAASAASARRGVTPPEGLAKCLTRMRELGTYQDNLQFLAYTCVMSALEYLGDSGGPGARSAGPAGCRPPGIVRAEARLAQQQAVAPGCSAAATVAAAELRGAAAACMLASCRAAGARLEALELELHPGVPPQLRIGSNSSNSSNSSGGSGGSGAGAASSASATAGSTELWDVVQGSLATNLTIAAGWLAGPHLPSRWLRGPADLAAAQPLRLLSVGMRLQVFFLMESPADSIVSNVGSYSFSRQSALDAMTGAILELADREGTWKEVIGWLTQEGSQADPRLEAAAVNVSVVACLLTIMDVWHMVQWNTRIDLLRFCAKLDRDATPWAADRALRASLRAARDAWHRKRQQEQPQAARDTGGSAGGAQKGQEQQQCGRAFAAEAPLVVDEANKASEGIKPEEVVVMPSMCGNPRCGNFGFGREADLQLLCCGGCRAMRYCGKECQKEHWGQEHKEACGKRRGQRVQATWG